MATPSLPSVRSPRASVPPRFEKRDTFRAPMRIPVTVLRAGGDLDRTTCDIGPRGVFISDPHPPAVRQLVRLRLTLPDKSTLTVHGMVTHVVRAEGGDPRGPGMGVQLFGVDRDTQTVWWDLVRFFRAIAAEGAARAPGVAGATPANITLA